MKNKYLEMVENSQLRTDLPTFHPGDSVTVNVWVKEGDKARIQAFKGFVLAIKNRGINSAFTVRKMSSIELLTSCNLPLSLVAITLLF